MNASLPIEPEPVRRIGIIAGSDRLPLQVIEACRGNGYEVHVVAFEHETDPDSVKDVDHCWVRLGTIGKAFEYLRTHGVKELVMAGKIARPTLADLRPDAMAARLLAHIGTALFGGDNAMFTRIVSFLESEGFKVIGADAFLTELLAPEGLLGQIFPDKQAQADIELGVKVARALGTLDVGQAVIIKRGMVLGVEAAEGTDALIERCAALGPPGPGGVLIKAKKPQQERRVDLPVIGATTIEKIHRAGFCGIALEAGSAMVVDRKYVTRRANELGIFVLGFTWKLS